MALPHVPITPIPNTEPAAVPDLWNTRYQEIDENFKELDKRLVNTEALADPDPERYFVYVYGSESPDIDIPDVPDPGGEDEPGTGGEVVCPADCPCQDGIDPSPVERFNDAVGEDE